MKTRLRLVRWSVMAIAAPFGSMLCAEEPAASDVQCRFVDPSSAEARSYRASGEYAIDRLVMTMITDTAGAVARHTEVASLPTFHLKDVGIKNGTVAGLPRISAMKLTSEHLRNPENAPDAAEQLALKRVRLGLDAGNPPQVLVQRIDLPDGKHEWRVYKPLVYVKQCGTCHSKPDEQAPELKAAIEKSFPSDKSNRHHSGEWRGIFRVTVADPAPPPPPPKPEPAPAAAAKSKRRGR